MPVPVKRYQRRKVLSDKSSELLYYLRQEPGSFKTITLKTIAQRMERVGSLTAQDARHVFENFMVEIRNELIEGNKVKIEGLGTFQMTFSMNGTEEEKDCTVKKIKRVNIRFSVDNALRLANDSTATTRGSSNNVLFYIKGETTPASTNEDDNNNPGDTPGGNGGNDGDDGGFIDPAA